MDSYKENKYCDFSVQKQDEACVLTPSRAGAYTLYRSSSPDSFNRNEPFGRFEGEAHIAAPKATREYYHIIWDDNRYSVAAPRVFDAEGSNNLRELGGYNTADGRFVRWGSFWRSQRLSDFTPNGLSQLATLGIKYVLDLRSEFETSKSPDPALDGTIMDVIPAAVFDPRDEQFSTLDFVAMSSQELDDMTERAYQMYAKVMFGSEAYAEMFRRMACGDTPLLFHCTAGKDRTGVAAALILAALGVDRDIIMADYLLSRELRAQHAAKHLAKFEGQRPQVLAVLGCLFSVEERNLKLSFDTIFGRYSGIEQYLQQELGVSPAALQSIRERYLVNHEVKA